MNTCFTTSPDHTRIAFDVRGAGTPILLLHGGGGSRADWRKNGYVAPLSEEFTVIVMDLRGHGESSKPTDPTYYTTERMGQDILAVADACNLKRFILCGYSFGGKVGSYLAARSDRISKLVMLGNRLGAGVSVEFRQVIFDLLSRWQPVVDAVGDVFDPRSLPAKDQEDLQQLAFSGELLPSALAWSTAMLDWGTVTPKDPLCPTLWLIGSENDKALDTFRRYEDEINDSNVQVHIVKGLNHEQEFNNVEQVLPVILSFMKQEE